MSCGGLGTAVVTGVLRRAAPSSVGKRRGLLRMTSFVGGFDDEVVAGAALTPSRTKAARAGGPESRFRAGGCFNYKVISGGVAPGFRDDQAVGVGASHKLQLDPFAPTFRMAEGAVHGRPQWEIGGTELRNWKSRFLGANAPRNDNKRGPEKFLAPYFQYGIWRRAGPRATPSRARFFRSDKGGARWGPRERQCYEKN